MWREPPGECLEGPISGRGGTRGGAWEGQGLVGRSVCTREGRSRGGAAEGAWRGRGEAALCSPPRALGPRLPSAGLLSWKAASAAVAHAVPTPARAVRSRRGWAPQPLAGFGPSLAAASVSHLPTAGASQHAQSFSGVFLVPTRSY